MGSTESMGYWDWKGAALVDEKHDNFHPDYVGLVSGFTLLRSIPDISP